MGDLVCWHVCALSTFDICVVYKQRRPNWWCHTISFVNTIKMAVASPGLFRSQLLWWYHAIVLVVPKPLTVSGKFSTNGPGICGGQFMIHSFRLKKYITSVLIICRHTIKATPRNSVCVFLYSAIHSACDVSLNVCRPFQRNHHLPMASGGEHTHTGG